MAPVQPTRKPKRKLRIQPWTPRWWSRGREDRPQVFLTRAPPPNVPTPPVAEDHIKLTAEMEELFGPSPAVSRARTPTYQVEELSPIRNMPVGLESPSLQTMKEIEILRPPLDRTAPFFISIPWHRIFGADEKKPPPTIQVPESTVERPHEVVRVVQQRFLGDEFLETDLGGEG
ncbi:hypothetical protein RN001_008067 [Aquatica leii]|uniref:Uncharacterized protein n=1 Tax=Aquatica leii TaxID=1421715 RepID=A0AAN7PEP9_9COLE|nr:hypothetical protein RN001_008067 [Aquatica leii]